MMHWQFPPVSRPRNPLLQVLFGIVGLALIVGIGLFALGALAVIVVTLAIGFTIRRAFSSQAHSTGPTPREPSRVEKTTSGNVIDGEFEIIHVERRP